MAPPNALKNFLNLLLKSGVDKRKSVEIAIHFAHRSDAQTTAFLLVFKGTFLEKYILIWISELRWRPLWIWHSMPAAIPPWLHRILEPS